MLEAQEAKAIIAARLSKNRCRHSLAVAEVARDLAEKYGDDSDRAYLTGLLHDYAKGMAGAELLKLARENKLITDAVDELVPDLLHAPVGAFLLARDLKITDPAILQAVASHTLGALNMTVLDKIIFLADMIEPGRDFPGVERLRCLTGRNLDEAMLFGLDSTIKYCIDAARALHPKTILVRNKFLTLLI